MTCSGLDTSMTAFTYRYDLFISYSATQETDARAIHRMLDHEMAVFFAPETLPTIDYEPEQYVEVLTESLAASCQVLVLLSEKFLESSWCQLELYGYLNLCLADEARRLWIVALDPGIEKKIGGQFVPLICSRDDAIARIRQRHKEGALKAGDVVDHRPPRMFVALPLYELYEPPGTRRRPPWGKDARAPHGMPGAPPFDIYEKLVREYMVQLSRRRADKTPDPLSLDEEEHDLRLSIPMQGVAKKYDYMSRAARSDADDLLRMGFLGHTGNSARLDGRYMFARSMQAQLQGRRNWEVDVWDPLGRIWMGQLGEIHRLEQAIAAAPSPSSIHVLVFKVELARAKYLTKDYAGALEVLEALDIEGEARLVQQCCLARLGRLTDAERTANRNSDVRVTHIRMHSPLEDRDQLDFWAEGLKMAGYRD